MFPEALSERLAIHTKLETGIASVFVYYDTTRLTPSHFQDSGLSLPADLSDAVNKRQVEYLAGRYCAAQALALLEADTNIVGRSSAGLPIWPQGFRGSITHARGMAAAAVAPLPLLVGIGIDSEYRHFQARPALRQRVVNDAEWSRLTTHLAPAEAFLVAFSAKESLYKCLHPLCQTFFGFQDAHIIAATRSSLTLQLLKKLPAVPRHSFSASYQLSPQWVHTRVLYPYEP